MSKLLKLQFNTATLYEAVKADTYITGEIDKSENPTQNAARAYAEQAGDDAYHERKLKRTLAGAIGRLEANLAEFVDSAEGSISDNLSNVLDTGGDFYVDVTVSSRFNSGLAFPIGQLAFQFVCNTMIYLWWQAINPNLAKDYLAYAQASLQDIRLCLAKTAPAVSNASYADITGIVTNDSSEQKTLLAELTLTSVNGTKVYIADVADVIQKFSQNNFLRIQHSDPSAAFEVARFQGATETSLDGTKIFEIASTPHDLLTSEYRLLTASEDEGRIYFKPKATVNDNSHLLIYTQE